MNIGVAIERPCRVLLVRVVEVGLEVEMAQRFKCRDSRGVSLGLVSKRVRKVSVCLICWFAAMQLGIQL